MKQLFELLKVEVFSKLVVNAYLWFFFFFSMVLSRDEIYKTNNIINKQKPIFKVSRSNSD